MKEVPRTIRKHFLRILNWVKNRDSNGILEGLNSLVQAAKSKARGYRTPKDLKVIAYRVTVKLDLSKVKPAMGI